MRNHVFRIHIHAFAVVRYFAVVAGDPHRARRLIDIGVPTALDLASDGIFYVGRVAFRILVIDIFVDEYGVPQLLLAVDVRHGRAAAVHAAIGFGVGQLLQGPDVLFGLIGVVAVAAQKSFGGGGLETHPCVELVFVQIVPLLGAAFAVVVGIIRVGDVVVRRFDHPLQIPALSVAEAYVEHGVMRIQFHAVHILHVGHVAFGPGLLLGVAECLHYNAVEAVDGECVGIVFGIRRIADGFPDPIRHFQSERDVCGEVLGAVPFGVGSCRRVRGTQTLVYARIRPVGVFVFALAVGVSRRRDSYVIAVLLSVFRRGLLVLEHIEIERGAVVVLCEIVRPVRRAVIGGVIFAIAEIGRHVGGVPAALLQIGYDRVAAHLPAHGFYLDVRSRGDVEPYVGYHAAQVDVSLQFGIPRGDIARRGIAFGVVPRCGIDDVGEV